MMATNGNGKPTLLALLICEQVLLDESKIASLIRVVDTFNATIELEGPEGVVPPEIAGIGINVKCVVFTRWGPARGRFTQLLRLVMPNGDEAPSASEGVQFEMKGDFGFYQIRNNVNIGLQEAGTYAFRIYLDGTLVGEHPFRVNINRRMRQPSTQQEQG
jgi:hypothetical protein